MQMGLKSSGPRMNPRTKERSQVALVYVRDGGKEQGHCFLQLESQTGQEWHGELFEGAWLLEQLQLLQKMVVQIEFGPDAHFLAQAKLVQSRPLASYVSTKAQASTEKNPLLWSVSFHILGHSTETFLCDGYWKCVT